MTLVIWWSLMESCSTQALGGHRWRKSRIPWGSKDKHACWRGCSLPGRRPQWAAGRRRSEQSASGSSMGQIPCSPAPLNSPVGRINIPISRIRLAFRGNKLTEGNRRGKSRFLDFLCGYLAFGSFLLLCLSHRSSTLPRVSGGRTGRSGLPLRSVARDTACSELLSLWLINASVPQEHSYVFQIKRERKSMNLELGNNLCKRL